MQRLSAFMYFNNIKTKLNKSCMQTQRKILFNNLYDKYAELLFLLILRYVGHENDAEEVLQRGFIKAYNKLSDFKKYNEKATKGWLSTIMINESLLYLREKKRLILFDNSSLSEYSNISTEENEIELTYEECLKLVQELPLGYRTVFNLNVIEGYKHAEISNILNITESSSRSQLTRARAILITKIKALRYETKRIG